MGHRAWVATTRRVPAASTWLVQILPLELEAELFRQGEYEQARKLFAYVADNTKNAMVLMTSRRVSLIVSLPREARRGC